MKLNNIFKQALLLTLAVIGLTFTACNNDNEKNSAVILEAYGPSPAFRGGKLSFIGRNMDRVASIILPENVEITEIERVNSGLIKVTIPQNAEPGLVTLKTFDGNTIVSKSKLTYTEPIEIESITPNPVKPGELLTIEGDYLNLITRVIFADGVEVESEAFLTWERAKIEVIVPMTAQTGTITLADDAVIPMELESEEVLQVILPSVETVLDLNDRKPGDEIKTAVKDIDLVASVVLPDETAIDFTINENELSFVLPAGATDGMISMVAHSGVKVAIAQIGMAIPMNLEATPSTGLRGGDMISVKGNNMEIVTSVLFPNNADEVMPVSQTANEIIVIMPAMAQSGELTLNTASGNTATVMIETLKPTVNAYNPSPVAAGNDLIIEGENLDLVATVIFGGNKSVEPVTSSVNALTVNVPVDAESGEVTLVMTNGESVVCATLEVDKPVFCYIPVLPDADTEIHAGTILALDVENGDKLTGVQINGNDVQYINLDNKLYVSIPSNVGGNTIITLISSNGSIDYTIQVIGSGTVETVIMDEIHDLGNWAGEGDGGAFRLYKESFEGVATGSILKFYFAIYDDAQIQLNNANWSQWGNILDFNDHSQTTYEMEMTADFLDFIMSANDGWSTTAMVIQGKNMIISRVSIITTGGGASAGVVLMDTPRDLGNWAGESDGGAFRIYKEQFEGTGVKPGSILKFEVNIYGYGQIQINDAGWGQWAIIDYPDPVSEFEIVIDEDLYNRMLTVDDGWSTTALIVQGAGMIVNKVSLIP